jgi:hypothetical protein
MSYLKQKQKQLQPFIEKIIAEDSRVLDDLNLLSGYVWQYEGALEDMELSEFVVGLLDKRFSSQLLIQKVFNKVKYDRRNKKNITDSL